MKKVFFTHCEVVLFRVLVRLQEQNKIDIRNFLNNDFVHNLKGLKTIDEELNDSINTFLNLSDKMQVSTAVALDLRIREYCKKMDIPY